MQQISGVWIALTIADHVFWYKCPKKRLFLKIRETFNVIIQFLLFSSQMLSRIRNQVFILQPLKTLLPIAPYKILIAHTTDSVVSRVFHGIIGTPVIIYLRVQSFDYFACLEKWLLFVNLEDPVRQIFPHYDITEVNTMFKDQHLFQSRRRYNMQWFQNWNCMLLHRLNAWFTHGNLNIFVVCASCQNVCYCKKFVFETASKLWGPFCCSGSFSSKLPLQSGGFLKFLKSIIRNCCANFPQLAWPLVFLEFDKTVRKSTFLGVTTERDAVDSQRYWIPLIAQGHCTFEVTPLQKF